MKERNSTEAEISLKLLQEKGEYYSLLIPVALIELFSKVYSCVTISDNLRNYRQINCYQQIY